MTAREEIFSLIRSALAPLPNRTPRPHISTGAADAQWLEGETDTLELFIKRATAAGTVCFRSPDECRAWLSEQDVDCIHVASAVAAFVSAVPDGMRVTSEYTRADVDTVPAAITPAAAGIAESGTIVLTDATSPDRLAELAPWIHIAVVRRDSIHRSIGEAIAAMPDDPNIIWVTGPSKTADVEGILIQGVHGPGIQGCLLV